MKYKNLEKYYLERNLVDLLFRVHLIWIMENVFYKDHPYYANVPEHKGKSMKEIKELYPDVNIRSIKWFFEVLEKGRNLKIPAHIRDYKKRKNKKGTNPAFIGFALEGHNFYLFSFNKNGITKDVFYLSLVDKLFYRTFSTDLFFFFAFLLLECKEQGIELATREENIPFSIVSPMVN